MIKFYSLLYMLGLCFFISPVSALTIEITSGGDNPIVISNVPFAWQAKSKRSEDIAAIVDADLKRSGYFAPLQRSQMFARPNTAAQIEFANWRKIASEYLVIGQVNNSPKGIAVSYELFNIVTQERVASGTINGATHQARAIAHKISDIIFKKITGLDGIFSTSILYVTSRRIAPGRFSYQLVMADADAENPRVLLESTEPIASPSWSPDKTRVAYVSFENGRSEIFVQSVISGKRSKVSAYSGLNGSPAWSPDGQRLAMTLSKDGNPEIYVLNLATKSLLRVTRNSYAIDTEASWFPDGQNLIFTSDRGGQPQLYKVNLSSGQVARLTFNGSYNARGQVFPNGKGIVMIHRQGQAYRIATQNLQSGQVTVLSDTAEDESPSVAANSNMVMYATSRHGHDTLAVVSVDGRTRYYLPSRSGDVRDPAWSK